MPSLLIGIFPDDVRCGCGIAACFQTHRPKTDVHSGGNEEQTGAFPNVCNETRAGIAIAIFQRVTCGPTRRFASRCAMFLEAVCERSHDLRDI